MTVPVLLLLAFFFPAPLSAAPPSADWRSLETARFRVHYPAAMEEWARQAAARAEAVADEVHEWVGYAPEGVVDIIVADPFNQPNGMALPFHGRSRMVLFTTPPSADSVIGHYSDWAELLIIHEHVHLAHLSRPARRSAEGRMGRLWLPAASRSLMQLPMWATEGYATHLEGRLTGSGRPNSDLRAALIREWARQGHLPDYQRLQRTVGQDSQSRLRAYLVGSAYFDWLEAREDQQAFRDVWARMTAHTRRDFDQAFKGVFGDSPGVLYQRFVAETTHAALEAEALFADTVVEGNIWQAYSHDVSPPAVSPDGQRLALVMYPSNSAPVLQVLDLDDNEDAFEKWREAEEKRLEQDTEDVMAVRPDSLPRKALHELKARDGRGMYDPRWIGKENALLFSRMTVDGHGFLASDLYRWDVDSNRFSRITELAGLHRADPEPGGDWAVAVRYRNGYSGLVRVDLHTGAITPLSEPSTTVVHDQPRVHPDGRHIAYMQHEAGAWRLLVRELASGQEAVVADSGGHHYLASPVWSDNGDLYFSQGERGFIAVYRWRLGDTTARQVTASMAAALSPAPVPGTDELLYLRPGPTGMDIMKSDSDSDSNAVWPRTDTQAGLPVLNPAGTLNRRAPAGETAADYDYGRGPQFATALIGSRWSRSDTALDVGIKGGDLIGRSDWLLAVSQSSRDSENGALVAAHWRGWPVDLSAALFHQSLGRGEQRDSVFPNEQRSRTGGLLLAADRRHRMGNVRTAMSAGAALTEVTQAGMDYRRDWGWVEARSRLLRQRGDRRLDVGGRLGILEGQSDDSSWSIHEGGFFLAAGNHGSLWGAAWDRVSLTRDAGGLENLVLGGQQGLANTRRSRPGQIFDPALPMGVMSGREYEGQSLYIRNPSDSLRIFYRRHRMGLDAADEGDWLALRGIEFGAGLGDRRLPLPELRGVRLEAGMALVQDNPLPDRTRAWVNLRYDW